MPKNPKSFLTWLFCCSLLGGTLLAGACTQNTVAPSDDGNERSSSLLQSSSHNNPSSAASSSSTLSSSSAPSSSSQTGLLSSDSLFVAIDTGTFVRSDGIRVRLTAFRMTSTEVDRALWALAFDSLTPAPSVANLPKTEIHWYDAIRFCNALSHKLGRDTAYFYTAVLTGGVLEGLQPLPSSNGVRIPTEAQWEFAIRASSITTWFWGDNVDFVTVERYAIGGAEAVNPSPVGSREPNEFGLYDMAGNVAEWTADWYAPYPTTLQPVDPTGPSTGVQKVVRGGAFDDELSALTSSNREVAAPDSRSPSIGLRVVLPR